MKFQPNLAQLLLTLGIPEHVLAVLHHRNVGVHAAAIDTDDGLGKEAGGQAHFGCDLTADQLVDLDLVGRVSPLRSSRN